MRAGISSLTLLTIAAIAAGQSPLSDPPIVMPPLPVASVTPTIIPPSVLVPANGQDKPLPPSPPPMLPPTPMESVLTPHTSVGQQHMLGVELQFGRPTGLRLQYAIYHGGNFSILAEVFGGAKSAFWGEESVFGIGGRAQFTLLSNGVDNALLVAPGIGISHWQGKDRRDILVDSDGFYRPVYRHYGEDDRYYLNLDVNVGWLHELSPQFGWELGLNFGVRVGLTGEERDGRNASGRVNGGTVGIYTGFRY